MNTYNIKDLFFFFTLNIFAALTYLKISPANKDEETSAYFWNESAKALRLEGVPRKAEWADWAAENARRNLETKKMIKVDEAPFIPVHIHLLFLTYPYVVLK
jgi:hypothetical protein